MVTRSLVTTLPSLKSSITHQTLVVSTDASVMDAIALLSGMTAPEASTSQQAGEPPPQSDNHPSCVLVQEAGKIVGIMTSKDVMRLVVQQLPLEELVIGQVMSHPVITLRESELTDAAAAIQLLEQHQIQHLPLLNEKSGIVGLLTYKNLCQAIRTQTLTAPDPSTIPYPSDLIPPAPVGVFKTDATGKCIGVNARCCEISGLTPALAIGDGWQCRLHPEDRERVTAEWYQSVQENRPFQLEYRFQSPDGKVTWVYGQAVAEEDENGQTVGYIGTITDISDRKKTAELLRQSEERYRSIYDQAAVGFVNATFQGNLVDVNPCLCRMLGYSRDELLQKTALEITHPDDHHRFFSAQHSLGPGKRSSVIQEQRYLRKDGSYFWARICISAVRGSTGQIQNVMAVIQDISDRKAAEISLNNVVAGTAATIGIDFFPALVRHIAQALNVDYVLISERVEDKLNILAAWGNGKLQKNFSFPFVDSPCEKVLVEGRFHSPNRLQENFPNQLNLEAMEAESYLGIALKNAQGISLGNLCILDRKAMPAPERAQTLLTVFAARAAAELERKKATSLLEELNANLEQEIQERTGALQEREARYRALMEGACDAIIVTDTQGNILEANQKAEELFGYIRPQLTTMHHSHLHPLALRESVNLAFLDCIECQQNSMKNIYLLRADGQLLLVDVSGTTIKIGDERIVQSIFRDVTEREQIKATLEAKTVELQEREKFLKTVLDAFPFPIFWKDVNSIYLGGNHHYLQDTNLDSVKDLIGKSDNDLLWSKKAAEAYKAHDQEVMKSGSASHTKIHTRLKADQEKRWFEAHKTPLRNIHGETVGIVGMYQDISDRQQAELRLQQTNQELARATRLKDEFLANMSHELRTPLNAIQGMTEGLQEQVFGDINEKQLNALQTIEHSSVHLLELINDILDVAKIEAGQVELHISPTGLLGLCESSLAFIKQQAQKKLIQVKLNIPPDLPIVMVDSRRLRQALINLLSNAVKFTPNKGCITLNLDYYRPTEKEGDIATPSVIVTFAVHDNGIGIASEKIGQLFQPFVQIDSALNRQYQGTGLGLALVKRIAELHGGQVALESELGQGSCFTLTLPCETLESQVTQPRLKSPEKHQSIGQQRLQSSTQILLVEDNEENILTLSSYLKAKGYQLCFAKNGREAIAQTQTEQPDVILMDIQLPGMDGLEAIRNIRLELKLVDIPIIALTALAMRGDRERCLAAGANEYLSKPVKLQRLVATIQQLLRSQTTR